MYSKNAYNAYKQNSINYASKEQMLLIILDAAVKYSQIGRKAIEDGNIESAHENIMKTQDIFYELMTALEVEKADNWGRRLMAVYEYIAKKLTEANIKKQKKILDEIMPLIEEVRDMWYKASKLAVAK